MDLKFKRKDFLDDMIILLLLLQVMIIRWIGLQNPFNDVLIILIFIDIVKSRQWFYSSASFVGIVIIGLFLVVNYCLFPGSIALFLKNVYRALRGILVFDYITRLIHRKPDYVTRKLKDLFIPVNAYLLLNVPILLLQSTGMTRLAALDMSKAESKLEMDYYSGLFGLYGTPCLAIFCTFVFMYNIMYIRRFAKKRDINRIRAYNFAQMLFFAAFSVINDNKFFYVELVIYGIIIYICINSPERIRRDAYTTSHGLRKHKLVARVLLIFTGIVLLGGILYRRVSAFTSLVDLFIKKFKQGLDYNNVRGGGERIGLILYMLNSDKRFLGYGLSRITVEPETLGFKHFGQGDVGTFITFGGILYIVVLFVALFIMFKRPYEKVLIPAMLLAAFFIMGVYTNSFHNTSTMISLVLIYMTCWGASHPSMNK